MNKWQDFLEAKEAAEAVWKRLKGSFEGEISSFLKKSYLVIAYGSPRKQMPFEVSGAGSIAKEHPGFFVMDIPGEKFTGLAEIVKQAETRKQDPHKKTLEMFESFGLDRLKIVPFQVEVRFPSVNIEFIQKIKRSEYCDKERTMMSKASINVVLKTTL